MKILGIESAATTAGVAVMEDDHIVGEYTTDFKKTHSQTLLPMIASLAEMIDLDKKSLDAIAVSGGPGSFTGLRIGSTTAKGLGLALDKPLIHVPTLDAMAYQIWGTDSLILAMLDARKENVFAGLYENKESFQVRKPAFHASIEEVAALVNDLDRPVILVGDAADLYWDKITEIFRVPVQKAPAFARRARASAVAALGMEMYKAGKIQTAAEHVPDYLRVSQAERQLQEAKEQGKC